MTTLLVLTVGHSDVQLVMNDQRHKLDAKICGTLHDEIGLRSWSVSDAPSARSQGSITILPEGDLTICTPKVDAVLSHFGETHPISALIFETNRCNASDPRLSGSIVERRLRERGVSQVTRVAFLSGAEQLEDPTNDIDAVVRRSVVTKLSSAIDQQVKALSEGDSVYVATTGGLAAANELINELVRLHAVGGPIVTALEVPDGNRAQQEDRAVEEKFHPAAGYRARWHALSLVEKGNLLGARGAVNHLEGTPGQEWTQVIQWLARFASSLPLPTDCDLAVLSHQRMAARVALRVELALRADDIPRAVHGTVAFFEAALWDWLKQRDFAHDDGAAGDPVNGFVFNPKPTGEKKDRFSNNKDGTWRINDFNQGVEAWLPVLSKASLSALWGALKDVRNLRNDVAHNEPTTTLMNEAKQKMRGAKLWSHEDTFLSQPLVHNVLIELGVERPDSLLDTLLDEVRKRLRHTPTTDGASG